MSKLWKLAHERASGETRDALKLTEDRIVIGVLLWGVWLFFVWMHEGKAAGLKLLLSLVPLLIFPLVYAMKFIAAAGRIYDEATGQIEECCKDGWIRIGTCPPRHRAVDVSPLPAALLRGGGGGPRGRCAEKDGTRALMAADEKSRLAQ